MEGVYAVQRRTSVHGTGDAALADAVEAVRHIDGWYSHQPRSSTATSTSGPCLARARSSVAPRRARRRAGGVRRARHHRWPRRDPAADAADVRPADPDSLPVIAWSAGAMALTSRVVLFHDFAPHGSHEAEVYDRGLGRVPGVVALPHARRRLRLDDRARSAVLARRFAEHRLLLLDDGTSAVFDGEAARRARPRRAPPHGCACSPPTGRCRRWARREQQADGREPAARTAPGRRCCHRPVRGRHGSPIIEGERATFLFRGEADAVSVRHRVVGLPDPLVMRRPRARTCGRRPPSCPRGHACEYQLELRRGEHHERFNDPQPPGRPQPRGVELGLRGRRLRGAGLGAARPGRGRANGRAGPAEQGAAPGPAGAPLPAGALPARSATPCWWCTTAPTTSGMPR